MMEKKENGEPWWKDFLKSLFAFILAVSIIMSVITFGYVAIVDLLGGKIAEGCFAASFVLGALYFGRLGFRKLGRIGGGTEPEEETGSVTFLEERDGGELVRIRLFDGNREDPSDSITLEGGDLERLRKILREG